MQSFTWTAHPWRSESPVKSASLVIVILGTSVVVGLSFESGFLVFFSFVVLTAAMSRYFLPTHYAIDVQGIAISHVGICRRYSWGQFRRVTRHCDGLFLSPFDRPSRLDSFQGQFLRTDHHTDEVFHVVQHHILAQSA
jgi:hypothetical protein